MNKVVISGNLTKDAELKFAKESGSAITKFTVAVQRGWGDKKETDYLNCIAFGKLGENIANFTGKGSKVLVEGSIKTGSYTNKEGAKVYTTDILCQTVEFLNSKKGEGSAPNGVKDSLEETLDDMFPMSHGDDPFA